MAVIAALRERRRRTGRIGGAAGDPVATLETVTERYPITNGVHGDVPYTAWVVKGRDELPQTGG